MVVVVDIEALFFTGKNEGSFSRGPRFIVL
jgi:hypothetical protein